METLNLIGGAGLAGRYGLNLVTPLAVQSLIGVGNGSQRRTSALEGTIRARQQRLSTRGPKGGRWSRPTQEGSKSRTHSAQIRAIALETAIAS